MEHSAIIRSDDLRIENRRRLLKSLRVRGDSTPSQLSDSTGLSAASVSSLCTQLIEQGFLKSRKLSKEGSKSSRGRPATLLSLNSEAGFGVSVDITIDRLRAQRIDYAGNVAEHETYNLRTLDMSSEVLISTIGNAIQDICEKSGIEKLFSISIGFQGVTEHSTGKLLWSPVITPRNVPLGEALQKRFAVDVQVSNDCQLMSEALSVEHHDTMGSSFATVLFSHGIGLGLFLNGRPFSGIQSSALELGHLPFERNGAMCRCGKRGCIEAYAARYGIERMAMGSSLEDAPSGRVSDDVFQQLVDQAIEGNEAAQQAFTIAGAAVAEGLVHLFTLFDPMPVALVGHDENAIKLIREGIDAIFKQRLTSEIKSEDLIRVFDNEERLLDRGLKHSSLQMLDDLFANSTSQMEDS